MSYEFKDGKLTKTTQSEDLATSLDTLAKLELLQLEESKILASMAKYQAKLDPIQADIAAIKKDGGKIALDPNTAYSKVERDKLIAAGLANAKDFPGDEW